MLHQISKSNSANEDINQEEVYEIMLERVDKNLLQKMRNADNYREGANLLNLFLY